MLLFRTVVEVDSHASKKNSKNAYYDKKSGRAWVTRSHKSIKSQNHVETQLQVAKNRQLHGQTIMCDVQITMVFYFVDFFTKKMTRNKKLHDLDNLLCLPLDALTKVGVIEDDSQVVSLDGCRRKPGNRNYIEIIISSAENIS